MSGPPPSPDMASILPGVVTVAGKPVTVTGGPWTVGHPRVRVSSIRGYAIQTVKQWDGSKWTTTS